MELRRNVAPEMLPLLCTFQATKLGRLPLVLEFQDEGRPRLFPDVGRKWQGGPELLCFRCESLPVENQQLGSKLGAKHSNLDCRFRAVFLREGGTQACPKATI